MRSRIIFIALITVLFIVACSKPQTAQTQDKTASSSNDLVLPDDVGGENPDLGSFFDEPVSSDAPAI